uniref:Phosphatidylinositol-glycan biosynthesis class X protein n=1 Tax=Steinernema glaseri TaxID=37863 RepID=A0A1I7ZSH0_9BILA
MRRTFVIVACLLLAISERSAAVARFEVTTVSSNSIVIRMIRASNVSRFDMTVNIYDLDRLIEFRQTELSASRHDKLFSFDGLTPSTWFAIRIQYRLVFQSDRTYSDFITKQELIVHTKNDSHTDWRSVDDQIIRLDGVVADQQHIDVSISSVFTMNTRVSTVIVPELQCEHGSVKPNAQKVTRSARVTFDLSKLGQDTRCSKMCIYPFVRAKISGGVEETFKGREWCGTVAEAQSAVIGPSSDSSAVAVCLGTLVASLLSLFL